MIIIHSVAAVFPPFCRDGFGIFRNISPKKESRHKNFGGFSFFIYSLYGLLDITFYIIALQETKSKGEIEMKQFVNIAKKSINDRDGFLNGLIKGIMFSAVAIVILTFLTGYSV